ncbi:hypothetical protein NL676_012580 [Syzygium grande]|nr:hypothetical protein NL676_012580 [Syzygium grande]
MSIVPVCFRILYRIDREETVYPVGNEDFWCPDGEVVSPDHVLEEENLDPEPMDSENEEPEPMEQDMEPKDEAEPMDSEEESARAESD